MKYDFNKGKKRIEYILSNKLAVDNKKSSSNAIEQMGHSSRVTSVFINILDASSLFTFTSEILDIFRSSKKVRDVGTNNDCVYAVFNTPRNRDVAQVMELVIYVNTYMKMLSDTLTENNYPSIKYGIGMSTDKEFVLKAERRGAGFKNLSWKSDSVTTAWDLSYFSIRSNMRSISLSTQVYERIINEIIKTRGEKVKSLFHSKMDEDYGNFYNTGMLRKYNLEKKTDNVSSTNNTNDTNDTTDKSDTNDINNLETSLKVG